MPRRMLFLVPLLAVLLTVSSPLPANGPHEATVVPYFTPPLDVRDMDCKRALQEELNNAQRRILIQAFRFTDRDITRALVRAHRHGVEVVVVLDAEMETDEFSQVRLLLAAGIAVVIDDQHDFAHNSVVLIDEDEVITGSYEFSRMSAKYNAENLVVVHSPGIAVAYAANFIAHANHTRPVMTGTLLPETDNDL